MLYTTAPGIHISHESEYDLLRGKSSVAIAVDGSGKEEEKKNCNVGTAHVFVSLHLLKLVHFDGLV